MDTIALYKNWIERKLEDQELSLELESIKGNQSEIDERFYKNLEFGTGGLRGVIGAGSNRVNIYTIRKATQGLATYLNKTTGNQASVALSYDSRNKSEIFAKQAAMVLAGNKINVYMYKNIMPTPCLSFAVRELKCSSGIMITASHNPAKYNGYKVYGEDGCQITNEIADDILAEIDKTDMFDGVMIEDFEIGLTKGTIKYIDDKLVQEYYKNVLNQSLNFKKLSNKDLKVVYTPLNGAGNIPVREILSRIGIEKISIVKEQEDPDGNFTTCPYPNPEIKEALDLGLKVLVEEKSDILLATDPDCDRVGVAVLDEDSKYKLISGNEMGILLFSYICEKRKDNMPTDPLLIKTIVTTDMADKIALEYGVKVINVLTGFKFIGEQIKILESNGQLERYLFGFEESYGYLSGTYVRDKDAVVASMLICEMASYYKSKGSSLIDILDGLYEKYGQFYQTQQSFEFEGSKGMQKMEHMMESLRNSSLKEIGGFEILSIDDYKKSEILEMLSGKISKIHLPKADVISFRLAEDNSVIIRPSGTEPKIKIYYSIRSNSVENCKLVYSKISDSFNKILKI